jgi:hypothetical protein
LLEGIDMKPLRVEIELRKWCLSGLAHRRNRSISEPGKRAHGGQVFTSGVILGIKTVVFT